jgi:protein SCO1/2
MNKKLLIYLGFFLALLLGFYFFVFKDYEFSDSRLPVINAVVPAFNFTDQNGKHITEKTTQDKVYVAEYFFTTCQGICPRMNANMRRVYDAYKDRKDFLILSHTCMPETDSVPVLKAYENKMIGGSLIKKEDGSYRVQTPVAEINIQNSNWYFLTGPKEKLYEMARKGYMIDNNKPDTTQQIKDQFIHTQFFAVVDRYGRVRGIYDGLKENEVQKLLKDIDGLLKEKVDHNRFLSPFSNNPG